MTASIAISSMAMAQSNEALNAEKISECKVVLKTFDSLNKPTVIEQREYSSCVYKIYGDGEPTPSDVIIVFKFIILVIIASGLIGLIKEFFYGYDVGIIDLFTSFVMWAIGSIVLMFTVYLFICAFFFLAS